MHCIGWQEISKIHGRSLALSISKTKYGRAPHIIIHKGWDFFWVCQLVTSSGLDIAMNCLRLMNSLSQQVHMSCSLTLGLVERKISCGNQIMSSSNAAPAATLTRQTFPFWHLQGTCMAICILHFPCHYRNST